MACLTCLLSTTVLSTILIGAALKIYNKLTTGWCKSKTCLVGKTAIVTGASAGIGYETALDFAMRGARVILACRDATRAENVRAKIVEETGNKNVVVRIIDMESFSSVRSFAQKINETETRLDILVNNAGVAAIDNKATEDGHVLAMQINYFSPFLLTILLIELLKKTRDSRIVNVSSTVAKWARSFDVKMVDKFPGNNYTVYYHSKLCNILFTIELAKKLKGTGVTTYSLHPGAVKTEIFRHVKGIAKIIITAMANVFFKTSEEGAQTTIYCSVAKDIINYNGEHFEACRRVEPYKPARDSGLSKKLWEITEGIVQLKPEEIKF